LYTDPKKPAVVPPKSGDGKKSLCWGVNVILCIKFMGYTLLLDSGGPQNDLILFRKRLKQQQKIKIFRIYILCIFLALPRSEIFCWVGKVSGGGVLKLKRLSSSEISLLQYN